MDPAEALNKDIGELCPIEFLSHCIPHSPATSFPLQIPHTPMHNIANTFSPLSVLSVLSLTPLLTEPPFLLLVLSLSACLALIPRLPRLPLQTPLSFSRPS